MKPNDLWASQLVFYPKSVWLTLDELLAWCAKGKKPAARYRQMLVYAYHHPGIVFYTLPGGEMGGRFGHLGSEYVSGLEYL